MHDEVRRDQPAGPVAAPDPVTGVTPSDARPSAVPLPTLPGPGDDPVPAHPGEPVEVDGRCLFVRTADGTRPRGEREPALFVHGIGGSSLAWTDVMHLLADRLDCESVDLPGFGRSDPPPDDDYSLDGHARTLARLVEERGRGPVHLVGNSLGGAVTTRLASLRPDLVRSLSLVSPALPDLRVRRGGERVLPLLVVPGLQRLAWRRITALGPEAQARAVLESSFHDRSRIHPARLAEAAEEVRRRTSLPWATDSITLSLRGLVSAYLQRGPASLWRQAACVEVPVLLVWGRHDRVVDVRLAERARRVFPDARLLVLEDAAHTAQLEQPEAVARAVLGRLEEARGLLAPGAA